MSNYSKCGCHTCGIEVEPVEHFTSIDGRILCKEHSKGVEPCSERTSKLLKMNDYKKRQFIKSEELEKEKATIVKSEISKTNKLNISPEQSNNYIGECKECIERQREVAAAIHDRGEIYKGEMRNTLDQLASYKEMLKILEKENEKINTNPWKSLEKLKETIKKSEQYNKDHENEK